MGKSKIKGKVLITGGTGYIATWIVRMLLEDGVHVKASVRNLSDEKKLKPLRDMANDLPGKLELFEADLLDIGSFDDAMNGCSVVMHTASPFVIGRIKDAQKDLVDPAVLGTKNVLEAVNKNKSVKKVVLTSSVASIMGDCIDVEKTKDGIFTEEHWNTSSSLKHQPYSFSKVEAEKEAWRIADSQKRWSMATINPAFVMGPACTGRLDSASIKFIKSMLDGQYRTGVPDAYMSIVDVRDVARAHIAAVEKDATGRHILCAGMLTMMQYANILREKYGKKYPLPTMQVPKFLIYFLGPLQGFSWKYINRNIGIPLDFDHSRSKKNLGIKYRELSDTLIEHAEQIISAGGLKK